MNAKCFGVALLVALAVGCGEGRAIFNVDVHSFLFGTGRDTVPYLVPASTTLDTSSVQHINLPGAGSSIVDTVHAIGGVTFLNASGLGTIRDRKSVVYGKSVDLGGRRIIKKKKTTVRGSSSTS